MNNLSNIRIGCITSSEIVALTSSGYRNMTDEELAIYKIENPKGRRTTIDDFGKPFYNYVDECKMERFFKMSLENTTEIKAFAWGKLCELIVHEKLPTKYIMESEITYQHPEMPEWCGTPDGVIFLNEKCDTVTDIKCPLTRKGFYKLVSGLYDFDGFNVKKKNKIDFDLEIQEIRKRSTEGEKYYWQLVSNAIIKWADYAELIVFMPYYEDIAEIKAYNTTLDNPYWTIEYSKEGELPFIYKESGIESINIIRFKVPQEDKNFLTERVKAAIELINK